MARREQIEQRQKRKAELVAQLASSRKSIARSRASLKEACNVKKKVSHVASGVMSQHRNKVILGSSVIGGLVISKFLKKAPEPQKSKSIGGWAKGLVIGFAMKKAKAAVVNRAKHFLLKKIQEKYQ